MPWFYLILAGIFEIIWAGLLKSTDGLTRPLPTAGLLAAMAVSIYFLAKAVQTLPVGTAYAVWTGIGAVGTAIVGIVFFAEPRTAARLLCIGLIVAGVGGLKYFSPT